MNREYVEERNGGYYVAGSRVSLDSVVYAFKRGDAPETIRSSFELLTLAEVYGAIAYYLDRRAEVDEYLRRRELEYQEDLKRAIPLSEWNPSLWERMQKTKAKTAQLRTQFENR